MRLADLAPPKGHTTWPRESAECLLELSNAACNLREGAEEHQVGLVARIEGWAKDGVPSVRLFDTVTNSLENGLELGQELVKRRLARQLGQEEHARLASHPAGSAEFASQWHLRTRSGVLQEPYTVTEAESLPLVKQEQDGKLQAWRKSKILKVVEELQGAGVGEGCGKEGGNWLKVKILQLSGLPVHLVTMKDDRWVSSAEISLLQASWRGWDLLQQILAKRRKMEHFQQERVWRHEKLWSLLEEAGVGGLVDKEGGHKEELVMFRLQDLPNILDIIGVRLEDDDLDSIRKAGIITS